MIPAINICVFCWAITEVVRYSFYTFKDSEILKILRYNLFLILYPLGVSGELLTILHSCQHIANDYPDNLKPLTLVMPNKFNITVKYEWSVYVLILVYASEFPKLFKHMLRQRAKMYEQ